MILPSKHIPETQTLLGIGAVILHEIQRPQTVTSLWEKVREYPSVGTFERFVLALSMLYIVGSVHLVHGMVERTGA